jgi:hypothetical protein
MLTFRHRIALFEWSFSAVFVFIVALFTYVLVRDGAPSGYSLEFMLFVMGCFWLGGIVLLEYASSRACVEVICRGAAGIAIRWRYPFKSVARVARRSEVLPASVVESQDSEGDPYFHARVCLSDGTIVDIAEGHDAAHCRSICDQFNAAVLERGG